jgi:hypothetical protein
MSARVAVALVHHPVLARDGSETTSTVTNLDVHDIARSAKTYGVSDYFVVHPVPAQRALVQRIIGHWKTGSSGERIPTRGPALDLVRCLDSLDAVYAAMGGRASIRVWATAARPSESLLSFAAARESIARDDASVLLLFGTSWGLPRTVLDSANAILEPIGNAAEYNHLSVRAACAIALDRLLRSA